LLRAALTNNPNLNLPAFSSGDGPWPFHPEQSEKSGQDGWAVHEAKGAGSGIPRAAQNDRQQEDGEGDMAFTAAETRLIAMMAKKSMPLHETVRALSEALPNVHPHKILDMAKLAVNPE